MKRISISELYKDPSKFENQEVYIAGWVKTTRGSKTFGFIELNDGSFFKNVQIVYEDKLDNFEELTKLTISSSLRVTGTLVLTPEAKQPFEIVAEDISISGTSTPEYPLQNKRHSMEFLRDIAHLRSRTNTFNAVFRVRSSAAFAIHEYFQKLCSRECPRALLWSFRLTEYRG